MEIEADTLADAWAQLNHQFLMLREGEYVKSGPRQVIPGFRLRAHSASVQFSSWPRLQELNFNFVGYTMAKWTRLCSVYLDPQQLADALARVASRAHREVASHALRFKDDDLLSWVLEEYPELSSSMSIRFNDRQDNTSGGCLIGMVWDEYPERRVRFKVLIRASEVTGRFLVDCIFFNRLIARLGYNPDDVEIEIETPHAYTTVYPMIMWMVRQGIKLYDQPMESVLPHPYCNYPYPQLAYKYTHTRLLSETPSPYGPLNRFRKRLRQAIDGELADIAAEQLEIFGEEE